MKNVCHNHFKLNELHDEIIKRVAAIAITQVSSHFGPPPSSFTFFVMGSAGRLEQSVWSDQDHGIVYLDTSDEAKSYFLTLGKEISKGLYQAGYRYCDGGVMASNPFWCKSLNEWEQQLSKWEVEANWESIRYLLIFLDSRPIYGESAYIDKLKDHIYQNMNHRFLLAKSLSNTLHLKKGINVLGQLLVETHGTHAGKLNIKEIGLFPYVNAIRLLSIKEEMHETSTLLRLEKLPDSLISASDKAFFKKQFLNLLNYRLLFSDHKDYDSGHYLTVSHLTKEQIREVKEIIKNGAALFHNMKRILEKDDSDEDE
jgi:CBS domain-containing protein